MLSGARPVESQGTPRRSIEGIPQRLISASALPNPHLSLAQSLPAQVFCKGLDLSLLFRIIWVDQHDAVEITITHMPNNGSWEPREQS